MWRAGDAMELGLKVAWTKMPLVHGQAPFDDATHGSSWGAFCAALPVGLGLKSAAAALV